LRLVVGGWFVLREKYCWLVADNPSEQAGKFADVVSNNDERGVKTNFIVESRVINYYTVT
jgi:hypothetical protein